MKILVTGSSGFIGFHLVRRLLSLGHNVVGIDNMNSYYDVDLKYSRLESLYKLKDNFTFYKIDLVSDKLSEVFANHKFDAVVNLAAQAGVRYSIKNPQEYARSNVAGFLNLLEQIKDLGLKKFIYASSSSVYGRNKDVPFSIHDKTDSPVSLYAATKKSNELIAEAYSNMYKLPSIGLRFFTVYGPYGRPDMAYFSFTDSILSGKTIEVFNNGKMLRDFTYIDDVIDGIISALSKVISSKNHIHKIYNLGNNKPVALLEFIKVLESNCQKKAKVKLLPMQKGDVKETWADIAESEIELNYKPKISIDEGLRIFVDWYRNYYG